MSVPSATAAITPTHLAANIPMTEAVTLRLTRTWYNSTDNFNLEFNYKNLWILFKSIIDAGNVNSPNGTSSNDTSEVFHSAPSKTSDYIAREDINRVADQLRAIFSKTYKVKLPHNEGAETQEINLKHELTCIEDGRRQIPKEEKCYVENIKIIYTILESSSFVIDFSEVGYEQKMHSSNVLYQWEKRSNFLNKSEAASAPLLSSDKVTLGKCLVVSPGPSNSGYKVDLSFKNLLVLFKKRLLEEQGIERITKIFNTTYTILASGDNFMYNAPHFNSFTPIQINLSNLYIKEKAQPAKELDEEEAQAKKEIMAICDTLSFEGKRRKTLFQSEITEIKPQRL